MPYRRVTYLEQAWYLIKWGIRHGFGGGKNDRKRIEGAGLRPGPALARAKRSRRISPGDHRRL